MKFLALLNHPSAIIQILCTNSFTLPVLYRVVCTVPYGEKWYVKDFVMYERNQNHQSWKWLCYRKNEPGRFPFIGFIWKVRGFFWHCLAYGIDKCYILDVLRGQPIKFIQVLSTSEFHEYWWKEIVCFFKILPSPFCKASEEQTWKRPYLIYCLTSEKVKGL